MDNSKKNLLSIWVGNLEATSYEAFIDEWMEEKYEGRDSIREGYSKFMETYRTGWYDHDFQDIHYVPEPLPLDDFVKDCSYFESYGDSVLAVAKKMGISECNTIIIIYDFEYPKSRAKKLSDLPLKFLGSFPYTVTLSKEVLDILNGKDASS